MDIELEPGKYIIAVSGGVDSMALLDLAAQKSNVELIVAHFDHGIHKHSLNYCEFVAKEAERRGLQFTSQQGKLGPQASEAKAREARYGFLRQARQQYGADAILTAHHQDDMVETIIINLLRGTGRKGLTSLSSGIEIIRPLLGYSKEQIKIYAEKHNLNWREDPTNLDARYLRNYIRQNIMPRLNPRQIDQLLTLAHKQNHDSKTIEEIIAALSQQYADRSVPTDKHKSIATKSQLYRRLFAGLPHSVAKEVMAGLLRRHDLPFDSKLLEKSVVFAKTAKQKKKMSISKKAYLVINDDRIELNLL